MEGSSLTKIQYGGVESSLGRQPDLMKKEAEEGPAGEAAVEYKARAVQAHGCKWGIQGMQG